MNVRKVESQSTVRSHVQQCSERNHVQQVAYSTYHDAITQVCFDCEKVRTTLEAGEDL